MKTGVLISLILAFTGMGIESASALPQKRGGEKDIPKIAEISAAPAARPAGDRAGTELKGKGPNDPQATAPVSRPVRVVLPSPYAR